MEKRTKMANLFLEKNEHFTLIDGHAKVFGASGTETIAILGTAGAIIDQAVERVEFNYVLSSYTLALDGNILTVNIDGTLAAKMAIQGNGTKLAFKDGSADMLLTGLGIGTLGGEFIRNTEGKVNGASLDYFDHSVITSQKEDCYEPIMVSATGIDHFSNDSVENASTGQYCFIFTQGTYNYWIQDFADGDNLKFAVGTSMTVNNSSATDGMLKVIASDATSGTAVSVTLTGIDPALDSTIFSLDTFNTAFATNLVNLNQVQYY